MMNDYTQKGISLENIRTRRGNFVLEVPALRVAPGKIACIVGPNGGGKTTLLLTVLGLLPHWGACLIDGHAYDGTAAPIKASIGFVPDDMELLFEELTALEQWSLTASLVARQRKDIVYEECMKRARRLASQISFAPPSTLAGTYSHGMRKKTQLVNALLGFPSVLVVDELRNGLDPIAIKQSENVIRAECDRGVAVLAATHDLWWAERFADYIYIVNQGSLVTHGVLKDLLHAGEAHLEDVFFRVIKV